MGVSPLLSLTVNGGASIEPRGHRSVPLPTHADHASRANRSSDNPLASKRTDVKLIERNQNLSAMAFHEKAGRSQVDSLFLFRGTTFFSCRVGHCRHASIRTLEERFVSLGACWAFSFQPVLPSVWRPVVLLFQSRTWARPLDAVTGTRLWAFVFSLPGTILICLLFTRLPPPSFGCCCATVRTLLRSPTGDAATPPAFLPSPRWLASFRFFPPRSASFSPQRRDRSRPRTVPGCVALLAPATFADTDRLLC